MKEKQKRNKKLRRNQIEGFGLGNQRKLDQILNFLRKLQREKNMLTSEKSLIVVKKETMILLGK